MDEHTLFGELCCRIMTAFDMQCMKRKNILIDLNCPLALEHIGLSSALLSKLGKTVNYLFCP